MKPILRHIAVAAMVFGMMVVATACAETAVAEEQTEQDPAAQKAIAAEESSRPRFTLDQVLDKMEAARKHLEAAKHPTFQAKVVNLREEAVLNETYRSEGMIQFKMPRLLRLELKAVRTGKEKIYIVGKEHAYDYSPQKNQAVYVTLKEVEDKKSKLVNPLEHGLAKDLRGLRNAYLLELGAHEMINDNDTIPIVLTPRAGESYDSGKMILWVETTTWLPVQIREFKSNNEIIDTYTFSDTELNVKIKDKTFTLPKGVEVHDFNPR